MKYIKLFENYNDDYITLKHLSSNFYIIKYKYDYRFFIYDNLQSLLKEKESDYKKKHIGEIYISNNWINSMVKKDQNRRTLNHLKFKSVLDNNYKLIVIFDKKYFIEVSNNNISDNLYQLNMTSLDYLIDYIL